MPRMSRMQFLTRAKQIQPQASRVLLTGHADQQSAIQAINDVGLYQYVEKPWESAQLLMIIQNELSGRNCCENCERKCPSFPPRTPA